MTQKIKARTKRQSLMEKTVMVAVEFRRIGNSRKLGSNQFEVNADKKMVRASKKLLQSAELKAIGQHDGAIRGYLSDHALPSMFKGGFWLIPKELVAEVDARLEEMATERVPLVEAFVQAYPTLMEEAKESLRDVFSERDYLSEQDVRKQFDFTWRYISFSVPDELEAIKAEVFEREKAKAAAHWETAAGEVQTLLREAMADLVNHMVERLEPGDDGKPKVFRTSTMDNLLGFLQTFDARNVTGDEELKALVDQARALVSDLPKGSEAATLRDSEATRAALKVGMLGVKQVLDGMVTVKPARRIRYDEPAVAPATETAAAPTAAVEVA